MILCSDLRKLAASADFRQILRSQIRLRLLVQHAHDNLIGSVVVLKVKVCPSAVRREISGKGVMIDDACGKVGALMAFRLLKTR